MSAELQGAQAIARACQILRLLGEIPQGSGRLTDIAQAAGLPKATAHRILAALRDIGFVENINNSSRYGLGLDLLALGAIAADRIDIRRLAEPALTRIAQSSGDTAFLSIRRGGDAICIDRQRGTESGRNLPVDLGRRAPLGEDAGGLALLAWLGPEEAGEIVAGRGPDRDAPSSVEARHLTEARRANHAFREAGGTGPAATATLAVPILDEFGRPIAALGIAALAARLAAPRRNDLLDLLWHEARQVRVRRLDQNANVAGAAAAGDARRPTDPAAGRNPR